MDCTAAVGVQLGGGASLLGDCPAIRRVLAQLQVIAPLRRTTLITGATGTGKDLVAGALHRAGQGPRAPFVVVQCGGLPETLAEDELFGHARGAFTGARDARGGLLRAGEGGTVFLDDIETLSPRAQASLLRFLETGELRRVGSDHVDRVSAWVIAASNADLAEAVRLGEFRADLLYRLAVMRIDLPPLHLRGSDVELLAHHFLAETAGPSKRFGADALAALHRYDWPGNVRELKHCVERAALLTPGETITADDLGLPGPSEGDARSVRPKLEESLWDLVAHQRLSLSEAVAQCERAIIVGALRAEAGNRTRAAERLQIHVRTMFKKLQQL